MADVAGPKQGLMNIGEEAKPPFVVLPDAELVFRSRAQRFAKLAPGHELQSYLEFLLRLTSAQAATAAELPQADVLDKSLLAEAKIATMPPLLGEKKKAAEAAHGTIRKVLEHLGEKHLPPQTLAAVAMLLAAPPAQMSALVAAVLDDEPPQDDIAARVLVAAGLQVHFAKLAATLDPDNLVTVADSACPACGSAPMASAVVGLSTANNTRFCTCSLCSTMWNVVRVKCVLCSATAGISYRVVEGKPDTIKAECCDGCHAYVKIFYQVNDPRLEPMADDVASLGLDMLLAAEDWRRGGRNPFLMGY